MEESPAGAGGRAEGAAPPFASNPHQVEGGHASDGQSAPITIGQSSSGSSNSAEAVATRAKRKQPDQGQVVLLDDDDEEEEAQLASPNGKQKRARTEEGNGTSSSNALLETWLPEGDDHAVCREVITSLRAELARVHRKLDEVRGGIPLCPVCLEGVDFPVSLSCGHLFCCTCVYRLVTREPDRERQRASACCPSCRAPITTAPRPPPLVFLQHLETLRREAAPPPDTSASPARQQRDERVDRTTYQLQMEELKEIFAQPGGGPGQAGFDENDGVYRCPRCFWEVVEGQCANARCSWTDARLSLEDEGDGGEDVESEDGEREVIELEENDEEEEEEEEEDEQQVYDGGYVDAAEEEEEGEEEDDDVYNQGYRSNPVEAGDYGDAEEEEGEEEDDLEEVVEEEGEEEEDFFAGGMLSRPRDAGDYGDVYDEEEEEGEDDEEGVEAADVVEAYGEGEEDEEDDGGQGYDDDMGYGGDEYEEE